MRVSASFLEEHMVVMANEEKHAKLYTKDKEQMAEKGIIIPTFTSYT